jgi:hypothetical protein
METLEVRIINPKATKLLQDLEELKLISIKNTTQEIAGVVKGGRVKGQASNLAEPIAPEVYPFRPQYLTFGGINYILRERLNTDVSYADGTYTIFNELLDITVWGKTRDEAEEAFAFTFHALHENYAKEHDKNLSADAIRLKKVIKKLLAKE